MESIVSVGAPVAPVDPQEPAGELVARGAEAPPTAKIVHPAAPAVQTGGADAFALAFQMSEDFGELIAALAAAQNEFTAAEKLETANVESKRTGTRYSYRYADLAELMDATQPALNKHGIAVCQFPFATNNSAGCVTFLAHTSRQWFRNVLRLPLGEVGKYGTPSQDAGAVITFARRYAWQSICGIAPTEGDPDGNPENVRREQRPPAAPVVQMPQRASAQTSAPAANGNGNGALYVAKVTPKATGAGARYYEVVDSRGRTMVTFDESIAKSCTAFAEAHRAIKEFQTRLDPNKCAHIVEVVL